MVSDRTTARIVGGLYLLQMTTAVLAYSVILPPILYAPDFLAQLAAHPGHVRLAMLLDLMTGASVFAIAVLLFPILKRFSERVALWYVGQRLTELVGFMVTGFLLMTILKLGQDATGGADVDHAQLETIARSLRSARGHLQNIALLIYCLGAWSLYGLLLRSRLLPRFIPIWGLLAVTLLFVEIMASILGTSAGGILIMMPLGVNEVFLGAWLIVRGFRPVPART